MLHADRQCRQWALFIAVFAAAVLGWAVKGG